MSEFTILLEPTNGEGTIDEAETLTATIIGDNDTVLEFVEAGAEGVNASLLSVTKHY